jgi:predicted chitinase
MRANEFLYEHKKSALAEQYDSTPCLNEAGVLDTIKQAVPAWAGGTPAANTISPKAMPPAVPLAAAKKDVAATSVPLETQQPLGSFLEKAARAAGIEGIELAQLLAQCRTETIAFTKLIEQPNKWMKSYEPVFKKDPKTGKVVDINKHSRDTLGNTKKGDGQRFIGRGYIQITGRKNYTNFANDTGMDVVNHPELLADPTNAAKAAIHYWTSRVRPRVSDFKDTAAVTRLVAGNAMKHLDIRFANFKNYLTKLFSAMPDLPKLPAPKPKKSIPTKGVKKAEVDTMNPDDNVGLAEGWLYTKFKAGHIL